MLKRLLLIGISLGLGGMLESAEPRTLEGAAWEAFVYGVENAEQETQIKLLGQKKIVRLAIVSESGLDVRVMQTLLDQHHARLVYRNGSCDTVQNNHDRWQIQFVLELADILGVSLEIHVWQPDDKMNTIQCFDAAGRDADVVLNYSSYWERSVSEKIANAAKNNPRALYVQPYGEVGKPTGDTPQEFARKFDGSGVLNLLTAVPLAPSANGTVLHPTNRDERDTQCIDFIVPAVYAGSSGVTCPAAGSLAALGCFAVAASDTRRSGPELAELLFQATWIPEQRLNRLSNFRNGGVEKFKTEVATLIQPDNLKLRRLYAPGIPDILKLCELIQKADELERQQAESFWNRLKRLF